MRMAYGSGGQADRGKCGREQSKQHSGDNNIENPSNDQTENHCNKDVCHLSRLPDLPTERMVSFLPPEDKCSFFLAIEPIENSMCGAVLHKCSKKLWKGHRAVTVDLHQQSQSWTESQMSLYRDYGRCLERLSITRTGSGGDLSETMITFFQDVANGQRLRVLKLLDSVHADKTFSGVLYTLLRQSSHLRVVDLDADVFTWKQIVGSAEGLDVLPVLLEPDTCPQLQKLRAVRMYRGLYSPSVSDKVGQAVLRKFTQLREVQLCLAHVTEELVRFLASADSPLLQRLTVIYDHLCIDDDSCKCIRNVPLSAWKALGKAKPNLVVELVSLASDDNARDFAFKLCLVPSSPDFPQTSQTTFRNCQIRGSDECRSYAACWLTSVFELSR